MGRGKLLLVDLDVVLYYRAKYSNGSKLRAIKETVSVRAMPSVPPHVCSWLLARWVSTSATVPERAMQEHSILNIATIVFLFPVKNRKKCNVTHMLWGVRGTITSLYYLLLVLHACKLQKRAVRCVALLMHGWAVRVRG
jgi:hypothetical protein